MTHQQPPDVFRSQRVRLLHVVGDSKYGGAAFLIKRLAEETQSIGWQTDVLTTNSVFQQALRGAGIQTIDLNVIWRDICPFRDLRGLLRLCRFLKQANYTIVHTHTSKGGFVGRLAAYLAGVPFVVHTVHGFAFHEFSSPRTVKVYSLIEKLAAHWADRIILVNEFHRHWAIKLGIASPQKLVTIPNGIPDSIPSLDKEAQLKLRFELGIPPDAYLIGSVGRLATQKGLEYAIHAMSRILAACPHAYLLLVGEGELRHTLEALSGQAGVCERIIFAGFRQPVEPLYNILDVFLLPSLWEGLSVALLEAMRAGKPIVASHIGSNRTIVEDGVNALLVPPFDSDALADAVLRLWRNPDLAARLGYAARREFESGYTEQHMIGKTQAVYADLLGLPLGTDFTLSSMCQADVNEVVSAHLASFEGFFLSFLGPRFLGLLYSEILRQPDHVACVARNKAERIIGFVIGVKNQSGLYRRLARQRWLAFAASALPAMLRNPSILPRLIRALSYSGITQQAPAPAALLSLAVVPAASGQGIGQALVNKFLHCMQHQGVESISLTTDRESNGRTNRFYQQMGFKVARTYVTPEGRTMNEYVIDLTSRLSEEAC